VGRSWVARRSGGGFEGDFVAEGFEVVDVVALGAFGAEPGVVEVRAEVGRPSCTAAGREASSASWASLLRAAARLTFRPSTSPSQLSRWASAMRATRLSQMSTSLWRWAGSGRSSGQRMQACS
jgi:hypothetical protein